MPTLSKVLSHFSLSAHPFERNVPPDGLYQHSSYVEALERLSFAIEGRSPALLTAPPGTGKSILLDSLRARLCEVDRESRFVYTPLASCGPFGLVGQLAARYGTPIRRSTAQTATALVDELSRSSRTEILFLDEAHRLPDASLEELRMLSNLDFDRRAPFCLVLAGQPGPDGPESAVDVLAGLAIGQGRQRDSDGEALPEGVEVGLAEAIPEDRPLPAPTRA